MRGARHECHVCVSRAVRAPGIPESGRGTGHGRRGARPRRSRARARAMFACWRQARQPLAQSPSRRSASGSAGRPVPSSSTARTAGRDRRGATQSQRGESEKISSCVLGDAIFNRILRTLAHRHARFRFPRVPDSRARGVSIHTGRIRINILSAGISPSKAQSSNDLNLNVGVVSAMHLRGPPDCPLGVACAHENQLQVGLPGRRLQRLLPSASLKRLSSSSSSSSGLCALFFAVRSSNSRAAGWAHVHVHVPMSASQLPHHPPHHGPRAKEPDIVHHVRQMRWRTASDRRRVG